MKKGISDSVFPSEWNTEESLKLVKKVGFDGIELNIHEKEGWLNLNTLPSEAKLITKQCRELGLEIPSLSTILHNKFVLNSSNTNLRKQGEEIGLKMIELAVLIGARVIQIVPGIVTSTIPYERAYELSQESISRLASEAFKANIVIGIENVYNRFLPSPLEFVRFLDEINHPSVQSYFNIGNAMAAGYPEHWISLLDNRITAIHAKDYRLSTNDFVPALSGDVNWPTIVNSLCKTQFTGYIITTPPRQYKNYPERLIEASYSDLVAILRL